MVLAVLIATVLNHHAAMQAGRLCVFIRTRDGQLIEVHPLLKVPPTYDEFRKLMGTEVECHFSTLPKSCTLAEPFFYAVFCLLLYSGGKRNVHGL